MHAVRKGRFSELASWQEQYAQKRVTAEDAVRVIRDGDRIVSSGGGTWPQLFDRALADYVIENRCHVRMRTAFMLQKPAILDGRCKEYISFDSIFFGAERACAQQGNAEFVPIHLGHSGPCHQSLHPRIVVMAVSPPDENGWMSRSIWGTHIHRDNFENPDCEIVIAEVNAHLPYLHSDGEKHTKIHVSEVDYIIEGDYLWPEVKTIPTTAIEKNIAGYIAELIPDGACLQLGFGGLANAVGKQLIHAGRRDLGLQSEVLTNSMADLMRFGVVNNSKKTLCPGRTVAAAIVGDQQLWDFCYNNPDICMKEIDWVNAPTHIAQNDRVFSINGAMEVDLTGQVASETVGAKQYTGTGGQLQWVIGSQWSKGGASVIALPSTYRDKTTGELRSKIKFQFDPGVIVTTPRTCVQYVVTEYGAVDLRYQSVRERARALASIAHPDFRSELLACAEKIL